MTARGHVRVVVTFGPTASAHLSRAEAVAGPSPVSIEIDRDARELGRLYRLLELVRSWRATTVDVDGEPEPAHVVQSMAHCARGWIRSRGSCHETYYSEVWSKCQVCPLFDRERAKREILTHERLTGQAPVVDAVGRKIVADPPLAAGGMIERIVSKYPPRTR